MKIKSIRLKSIEPQKVYDLVNSGPHHNFLVKTSSGAKIALHNCFLEVVEDSNKAAMGNYDAAEEMYNNTMNRMVSRFMKNGKLPGLIVMISSPNFPDDFVHRKIDQHLLDPENSRIFFRRRSTWEAKGQKYYPNERGHFFLDAESTEILDNPSVLQFLSRVSPYIDFPFEVDVEALARVADYWEYLPGSLQSEISQDFRIRSSRRSLQFKR